MAEGEGVEQWVLYFPSVMMEAALGVVPEEAVVFAFKG
jgi:hypothetical protein